MFIAIWNRYAGIGDTLDEAWNTIRHEAPVDDEDFTDTYFFEVERVITKVEVTNLQVKKPARST
jgi:hypothetical protein